MAQKFKLKVTQSSAKVKLNSGGPYSYERFTEKDLGETFLYKNKVLIARSSGTILLFKLKYNEFKGEAFWHKYF